MTTVAGEGKPGVWVEHATGRGLSQLTRNIRFCRGSGAGVAFYATRIGRGRLGLVGPGRLA